MASNALRILSIRFSSSENESKIIFELGLKAIERQIPSDQGFLRAAIILDSKNEISDVEIVTQKL